MPKSQMKLPLTSGKREARTQFAALCFKSVKRKQKTRVLLISSRRSGRWVIPKGWPMNGKTPAQSALREAYEEAGVRGRPINQCVGHFSYKKRISDKSSVLCIVAVYPVKVDDILTDYPEHGARQRVWLSPSKAAERVSDPTLKPILRNFDPLKLAAMPA
ncbi:MAG: NUDIX hydrolase [Rhodobacteraceae bacterium]|nr:NUDIX hydrolase [Paracoccaceae bacterium]MCY4196668.1 NUDIX hydrolase [Paracoccaceae bacterium]MCY4327492.1 NUDIX hydrolase [Paracoccaceae bacterium]